MENEEYFSSMHELLKEQGLQHYKKKSVIRHPTGSEYEEIKHFLGERFLKTPIVKRKVARFQGYSFKMMGSKEWQVDYFIIILNESFRPAIERFAENYFQQFGRKIKVGPFKPKGRLSILEDKIGSLSESNEVLE